ncbi:MAG: histidine--tRNA ligase [Deltaproteobacteria bacterium]|jgi:histidyl-tRNA synthetase|nr:histidine--tRNA ligase [Deltaproteobacteria bacterium]
MTEITAVRGFKDILPDQTQIWRLVEDKARDLARRFGYLELRVPILERTELFARGIGDTTDIVEKEMYTMEDRSGDKITLRPEATAGMVRAVLENNLAEGGRPLRLFCLGPMFRYERPQKGRQRQFHQLDVEVFGDPGPYIDAEVICLLSSFLTELGLTEVSVLLNSLGCPKCRPLYREKLTAFLRARQADLCPDCLSRLERNPLRILDCKVESCQALTADGPDMAECLCPECQAHLAGVTRALADLGLPYALSSRLVRGLDYYARTTFEIHSGRLGAQSAMAGGGRYDGLCRQLGGPDLPGIGFAVGLERVILALTQVKEFAFPGPDYYLAALAPETLGPAFVLAHKLRARGLAVEADWEAGSLKSRLKRADRLRAAKVIMLGPDELARNEVTIRDLATKEQITRSLSDLDKF